MCHDIAFTLKSLGMVQRVEDVDDPVVVVDWSVIDSLAKKSVANKTRIKIDPECLRWTPLISPIVARHGKDNEVSNRIEQCNVLFSWVGVV